MNLFGFCVIVPQFSITVGINRNFTDVCKSYLLLGFEPTFVTVIKVCHNSFTWNLCYVTKNDHFAQCAAYESGFSAESKIHCLYKKDDFANTEANCRVHTGIFPCLFVRQQ